jgi:hypothetical protein
VPDSDLETTAELARFSDLDDIQPIPAPAPPRPLPPVPARSPADLIASYRPEREGRWLLPDRDGVPEQVYSPIRPSALVPLRQGDDTTVGLTQGMVTAPPKQAVDRTRGLRDLLDSAELDLLAAEVMSGDPVIAARADERAGRLAGVLAEAFRRVLADAPESDAPLTLTARIQDSPVASIIAGPAATELGHRIVLRVANRTPVNLCP